MGEVKNLRVLRPRIFQPEKIVTLEPMAEVRLTNLPAITYRQRRFALRLHNLGTPHTFLSNCLRRVQKTGQPFRMCLSLDLERQVSKLLRFLTFVSSQKARLNGEPAIYNSYIDSYLKFIRLKAKYPNAHLIPTLEIEWVWYSMVD